MDTPLTTKHMQGYDADNPNIELLRLRNFTIGKKISDDEVTSVRGLDTIVDLIGTMTPFVSSKSQSRAESVHHLAASWGVGGPTSRSSSSLSESCLRKTLVMNADGAASHRNAKL
jgi:hypothetical protein